MTPPLRVLAETGAAFTSFGPYVPAVTPDGSVLFTALGHDGRAGVYRADGASVAPLAEPGPFDEVTSHPIPFGGGCAFFARVGPDHMLAACVEGAFEVLARPGDVVQGAALGAVGPLGPTLGPGLAHTVAFRASLADGHAAIALWTPAGLRLVADTRATFASFQGLPLATSDGVVFRAELALGRQGLYAWSPPSDEAPADSSSIKTLVETGGAFVELGRFPALSGDAVLFVAGLAEGGMALYEARGRVLQRLLATDRHLASLRGALPAPDGVVFYGADPSGQLAVHHLTWAVGARPPRKTRLFGLGDRTFGAPIAELALNPVSIAGPHLAARLRLADGRELIVGCDLGTMPPGDPT